MDYPTYLAQGWPIASGVIEGACRHFVKDRCELSGMRWTQAGAENLLRLRAVAENGDWDAYHRYRQQQRHRRLYGSSVSTQEPIEVQALDRPSSQPTQPAYSKPSAPQPIRSNSQTRYHELPLAV